MSALRKGRLLLTGLLAMFGLNGCEALRDYPKNIREFLEPWKVLEPGDPRPKFPTPRVISEGTGPVIGPGDLVQMHILTKFGRPEPKWQSDGNWWLWIGFRKQEETSFFANEPRVASALVGLREGAVLEFVEANDEPGIDSRYAGTLKRNVIGDPGSYAWRKNAEGESASIYVSTSRTPSLVEIKRVCKGQTKYRTVKLFDDSPVRIWRGGLDYYISTEPRYVWFDEARIEATCGDGKKVNFAYGPTLSMSGKRGHSPVTGYFDQWFADAWKKLPKGVQFEGNAAPLAKPDQEHTEQDKSVTVRVLKNDNDPDGDRLSIRILADPRHGKLTLNADNTVTYEPESGWRGADEFTYKASDGMVESEETRVVVWVDVK